jgi:hypothetical protein
MTTLRDSAKTPNEWFVTHAQQHAAMNYRQDHAGRPSSSRDMTDVDAEAAGYQLDTANDYRHARRAYETLRSGRSPWSGVPLDPQTGLTVGS